MLQSKPYKLCEGPNAKGRVIRRQTEPSSIRSIYTTPKEIHHHSSSIPSPISSIAIAITIVSYCGGGVIRERQPSPPRQREWTPPPEYKAAASIVKAEDDPEEFPGLRQAQLESFSATDEFTEAWSMADHRRAEEERRRRLCLVINLDDGDGG
ncbi:hypothetical protein QYE76_001257 [Lolium multiflorum]|uniref:Uncharacterized protein n=1 Tax=Lolium multiflorum TaxID=4521 RepID=A0AAD8VX51_LOLMU|nr:hypothetical protein QYE76_001257 [Lolium multiflorum]